MKKEKYIPADGDITVSLYRCQDEYSIIHIDADGEFSIQPFAKGKIDPSEADQEPYRPAYHSLLQWAKLSGRHVSELACSNPVPPKEMPREFLRITNMWDKKKRAITKRIPVPQFIADAWGTADEKYITMLIRKHVKFMYDCSHSFPIGINNPKLDVLVTKRMATPLGLPFSTQI